MPRPKRHTETAGFRKAARDQRRPGIQAEAEPVAEARGDGDDVLDRAAELHTRHVRTGIGSEPRRGEHFPQPCPKPFVAAAEHHRRGLAGRHLKGKRRPGKDSVAVHESGQLFPDHALHRNQLGNFDSFCRIDKNAVRGHNARQPAKRPPHGLARDRQDQNGDVRQHFRLFRTARIPGNSPDARMQLYAPQVTRVLMVRVDVRGLLRIP